MNKLIRLCLLSVFLTGCASSEGNSSSPSSVGSAQKDECAAMEYLARQQCLTDKLNAG